MCDQCEVDAMDYEEEYEEPECAPGNCELCFPTVEESEETEDDGLLCGPDCGWCFPATETEVPAVVHEDGEEPELDDEEDSFDLDWDDDDEDCDCEICKSYAEDVALEKAELRGDVVTCADISDVDCGNRFGCDGCPAVAPAAPVAPTEVDEVAVEFNPTAVCVTFLPGEQFPTVFNFNTDAEQANAFRIIFDAVTDRDDFDVLPAAVMDIVIRAIAMDEDKDVRDAVHALAYLYPFYVVQPL
jgi:hypothetical protein